MHVVPCANVHGVAGLLLETLQIWEPAILEVMGRESHYAEKLQHIWCARVLWVLNLASVFGKG